VGVQGGTGGGQVGDDNVPGIKLPAGNSPGSAESKIDAS
jgi:hypothetical protein